MLTVRAATAADIEVIAEFNIKLAAETESKQLDSATVLRGVTALVADPAKGRYFLACIDGAVVGQVAISFEWSDWRNGWFWWLQSVYVRSDWRGKGVFRALHHALASEARGAGAVALRLYVERENISGQRTYTSVGFAATTYEVYEQAL